ncbi:unnamed protein product [Cuscuta epithymum]|uniref:NPH3 domain-containing protein n=1 Tax=Cuscuta epithymum TaxID=186058 RepID=A0AAV0DN13_9ASTE|nr:unnamed protein product [Cuscuta epithymum]CAH9127607.1 unnamed protein product [Cuscuta epithymum]
MREVIEAVERALPQQKGLIPCKSLFEMLRTAISFNANQECRDGLELRIGKQLDQSTVKELLLIPHVPEEKYDTECLKRMLKIYYDNYTSSEFSGFIKVANLMEEFLCEVASDIDLKVDTFASLADLSASVSSEAKRSSDGIYRAIDIYLEKHIYLTEKEREKLCDVLDCSRMSVEACQHAAQNNRLPTRLLVQILFAGHMSLKDTMRKEMIHSCGALMAEKKDEGGVELSASEDDDHEVKAEIEKIGNKVLELEKECNNVRMQIQKGRERNEKKKMSVWKEMKRKFGCMTTMHDCSNSHVQKKKRCIQDSM